MTKKSTNYLLSSAARRTLHLLSVLIVLYCSYSGNVKINQLLNQEEGCTIEELLLEEERLVVLCRGGSIPKLIEFVCQKSTLEKLIQYSVQYP